MTVLYNGNIITMTEAGTVQALGFENGKIVFVGDDEQAMKLDADNRVDLQGKTLLPGFHDGHMHMANYGCMAESVTLFDCKSAEECVKKAKAYLDAHPDVPYLFARGFNEDYYAEKRYPTMEELDSISDTIPVTMVRVCGHVSVCNSYAIDKIKKLPQAAALEDQIIDGRLYEYAVDLFGMILPKPDLKAVQRKLLAAMKDMNACGITACQTDDFCSIAGADDRMIIAAFRDLEQKGLMTLRVYEQCLFTSKPPFDRFLSDGNRTGMGSDLFRIGPLKLLQDGSLGAKTALLRAPYKDSDSCGIANFTQDELDEMVLTAQKHDMQIAVHCIGDGALEMTLEALEKADAQYPRKDAKNGIVHVQITDRPLLERMKADDLVAYIQPVFVDYDMDIADKRVRGDLSEIYAWKTMEELGILTVGGSDSPVESFDILNNIYYAVTREHLSGGPEGGWMPHQKVDVMTALRMFTLNPAKACFAEEKIGSIAVGKYADFAVLEDDPTKVEAYRIKDIKVLATVLEGKTVYGNF